MSVFCILCVADAQSAASHAGPVASVKKWRGAGLFVTSSGPVRDESGGIPASVG